ncbi:hypothetical protein WG66_013960 [Moniliophthora roreri]|nr:hypothetical protein WG66_013960 [Moniliophthora roreri]
MLKVGQAWKWTRVAASKHHVLEVCDYGVCWLNLRSKEWRSTLALFHRILAWSGTEKEKENHCDSMSKQHYLKHLSTRLAWIRSARSSHRETPTRGFMIS